MGREMTRDDILDSLSYAFMRLESPPMVANLRWDSTRSDEPQQAEVNIINITVREHKIQVELVRTNDGQEMMFNGEGELYSRGSKHPLTGTLTGFSLKDEKCAVA